jgi:hypothetical protein
MDSHTSTSRAELELAEVTLRGVLGEEFRKEARADAQSLDRMLKHVVNMNGAISESPETHANVAKRLNDFAITTSRMAERHPDAAPQLHRLAEALQKASERLRGKPGA